VISVPGVDAPISSRTQVLAGLICIVLLQGCDSPGGASGEVVARFGNETLTTADLTATLVLMSRQEQIEFLTPAGRRTLVEMLVDRRLAAREAGRLDLAPISGGSSSVRLTAEQELELQDAWLARQLETGSTPVTEEVLRSYFESHVQDFARPGRVQVERILFPDRQAAMAARPELQRGIKFAAWRDSHEPSPIRVDSLWLQPREGEGDLERAAFALADGMVSEPLAAVSGFYMLRVMSRESGQAPAFDEVRSQVASRVELAQRAALLDSLRAGLRQGTRVEVDTGILENYDCERCAQ
jgi:parvulin-like peptidyl-prolyl isomerase